MISEHDGGDCVANCGDVLIRHWHDGEGGALDVTVTGPLSKTNVRAAAAEAGISLSKAFHRNVQGAAAACQQQGLVLLPLAVETLGGIHSGWSSRIVSGQLWVTTKVVMKEFPRGSSYSTSP